MNGEHAWFAEHMAAAVCGGLVGTEAKRFEDHREACQQCARAYEELVELDRRASAALADQRPEAGFEDRVIQRLREESPGQHAPIARIPRTFVRLVTGLAATILLGAIGFFGTAAMQDGTLERWARLDGRARLNAETKVLVHDDARAMSNMRQLASAQEMYANNLGTSLFLLTKMGEIRAHDFTVPSADSERDTFGGGVVSGDRANFKDLKKNLSYSAANMHAGAGAAHGFRWNDSISPDSTVLADRGGGSGGKTLVPQDGNDSILLPVDENGKVSSGRGRPSVHVTSGGTLLLGGQLLSGELEKNAKEGRSVSSYTDGPVTNVPGSLGGSSSGLTSGDGTTVNGKFLGGEVGGSGDGGYAYRLNGRSDKSGPHSGAATEALWFKPGELSATDGKMSKAEVKGSDPGKRVTDASGKPDLTALAANGPTARNGPVEPSSAITPTTPATPAPPPPSTASHRKIIRNGEIEFEVESFDAVSGRIERLAGEEGGFIATVNSERLANGKMKGSVVVRIPPDRLDGFVQKIRALGDLRSQRIGSQDVTKQYTDTESELKACRAMEGRLLDIIKTGKGEVKDLVAAEKELGEWRVRIEKLEGEIRYMSNLIAMSTLTISLLEKDIQAAARAVETETVNMGVETEDVEKQYAEVQKAIADAKGRVVDSKLNRHDAGQLSAVITADMPRDAAGPVVDRIKQLGRVARLDRQIAQTAVEGTNVRPGTDLKVERKETRLCLSLYNLANVAPRQTYNIDLAVEKVEEVYRTMTTRPAEAGGRVVTSNLTRPRADQTTGSVNFEVKTSESEAILKQIRDAGTVLRLTISENPDTANVTTAKQGFVLQIVAVASVPPRQSTGVTLAVKDVPAAHNKLIEVATAQGARMLQNQLNEADRQNITSAIDFEVGQDKAAAIESAVAAAGDTVSRSTQRVAESEVAMETKVRYRLAMVAADRLTPREQAALQVQVSDVAKARDQVLAAASESGGRIIENQLQESPGGRSMAKILIDLPLGSSVTVAGRAAALGAVVQRQVQRFTQAPEGPLARARVEVLLTAQPTLTRDDGLMAQMREGLSTSVRGLFLSVRLVVIGICLVAPIAITLWLVWRLVRRMLRKPAPARA